MLTGRRRTALLLAFGVALSIVLSSSPALAANVSCGNGWWGDGVCKYAKAKLATTCLDNCTRIRIDSVKWRGGTASQECDPTNDVVSWHLVKVKIVRVSDGVVRWSWGPSNVHYNCDVDAATYARSPDLTVSSDHRVVWKWFHGTESLPGGFYSDVTLYVSPR